MPQITDLRIHEGNLARRVGRTIVHEKDLEVRVVEPQQRFEAALESAMSVVTGDHDRNFRDAGQGKIWSCPEGAFDDRKRWLGLRLAGRQAHLPVVNQAAIMPPIVREA